MPVPALYKLCMAYSFRPVSCMLSLKSAVGDSSNDTLNLIDGIVNYIKLGQEWTCA